MPPHRPPTPVDRLLQGLALAIPLAFAWDLAGHGIYRPEVVWGAVALAAGLAWALRLPAAAKGVLVGLLVAVGLSLLGGELLLLTWLAPPNAQQVAASRGIPFDPRTRLQVVRALRQEGETAWPAYSAALVGRRVGGGWLPCSGGRLLPLAGISRSTTVSCNESGAYAVFTSDEHGFRNPIGAHDGGADLVVLGDSFAQGSCVPPGEELAAQLRREGSGVVSLGLLGAGPLLELAVLREYGAALRPRHVIWTFFQNDLRNLGDEWGVGVLRRYLEEPGYSQGLRERQGEVDHLLAAFIQDQMALLEEGPAGGRLTPGAALPRTLRLERVRELVKGTLAGEGIPHGAELPRLQRVLERARTEVAAWGGTLHFLHLPDYADFLPGGEERGRALATAVEGVARAAGLGVIRVAEGFRAHGEPLTLFALGIPNHYTAEGYGVVARAIRQALAR